MMAVRLLIVFSQKIKEDCYTSLCGDNPWSCAKQTSYYDYDSSVVLDLIQRCKGALGRPTNNLLQKSTSEVILDPYSFAVEDTL